MTQTKLILLLKLIVIIFLIMINSAPYAQTFEQKELSTEFSAANDIFLADLDGDGDNDIIAASSNEVSWFENLEAGKFSSKHIITTAVDEVHAVFAADIDGDGLTDVLSASIDDNKIAWYKNLGNGEFGVQIVISTSGVGTIDVYAGDIDNDGDIDVLACSYADNAIRWYKNVGGGNFSSGSLISTTMTGPQRVVLSDMDNDGDLDVVGIAPSGDKVSWFENLGGGIFGGENEITNNLNNALGLTTVDLDVDGDLDILTTNGWFENLGAGTFAQYDTLVSGAFLTAFAACDFDNDGDPDILGTQGDNLIVIENFGSATFGLPDTIVAWPISAIFASEVTQDGKIDIIVGLSGELNLFKNMGGLLFGSQESIDYITTEPEWIHLADIDGDGDKDLLSSNLNQLSSFENFNLGEFASGKFVNQAALTRSVDAADFDGDGDMDILASSVGGSWVGWSENLGNGSYGPINHLDNLVTQSNRAMAADIDGDGDQDIFFRYFSCLFMCSKLSWFENLGGGVFANKVEIAQTNPPTVDMVFEDFTGDQLPDIVTVSGLDLTFYKNLGGGNFVSSPIATDIYSPDAVGAGDIDLDGDLDIVTGSNFDVRWYENLGNGNFGPAQLVTDEIIGVSRSIIVSDINADNFPDIVIGTTATNMFFWAENTGAAVFDSLHIVPCQISSLRKIIGEDMDEDGDIDLFVASFYDNKISYFKNGLFDRNQLRGTIYYDIDSSGTKDSSEMGLSWVQVFSTPQSTFAYTYSDGRYVASINANPGDIYMIEPSVIPNWSISTYPTQYQILIDSSFNIIDSLDFGMLPNDTITNDLVVDFVPGIPRCNNTSKYWITIKNIGTTQPTTIAHLNLHDSITYMASNYMPDSIVGKNVYWSFDEITFFDTKHIEVELLMPGFAMLGDSITNYLNVFVQSGGSTVYTVADSIEQILICAYDPNDKVVSPSGHTTLGIVPPNTPYLEYIIHFQNTGNDTAFNVNIKDQIDANLDLQSLTPLASSHPMEVIVDYTGQVTFKFQNILLPDSNVNFLGSQGFVKYRIHLNTALPLGTQITNTAKIYFDANPPIITNTTYSTLGCSDSLSMWLINESDSIFCLEANGIEIGVNMTGGVFSGPGMWGNTFFVDAANVGDHTIEYMVNLGNGCVYFQDIEISVTNCLGFADESNSVLVFPNPFIDKINFSFEDLLVGEYLIVVTDISGREFFNKSRLIESKTEIDFSSLESGVYFITFFRSSDDEKVFSTRIIKK